MSGQYPASWTGTENQREPQRICLPPSVPMDQTPRYFVKPGVTVEVRAVDDENWKPYRTKKRNEFDRYEYRDGRCLIFRSSGYQMRVHCLDVCRLNDTYRT